MSSIDVKTQEGGSAGKVTLDDSMFGIEPNIGVMHQVVNAQLAARRAGTHSTKTRAEVAGGGAKPWRQKGTGRARHGSIRSPQWRGGGVAHGPPDQQPQGEQAVHDALPEFGFLRKGGIEMQGLGIHGERAKERIVHFRDRAPQRLLEDLSHFELFVIQSCHFASHCNLPAHRRVPVDRLMRSLTGKG